MCLTRSGAFLAASGADAVAVCDARTGERLWSRRGAYQAVVPDRQADVLYLLEGGGRIVRGVRAASGETLWAAQVAQRAVLLEHLGGRQFLAADRNLRRLVLLDAAEDRRRTLADARQVAAAGLPAPPDRLLYLFRDREWIYYEADQRLCRSPFPAKEAPDSSETQIVARDVTPWRLCDYSADNRSVVISAALGRVRKYALEDAAVRLVEEAIPDRQSGVRGGFVDSRGRLIFAPATDPPRTAARLAAFDFGDRSLQSVSTERRGFLGLVPAPSRAVFYSLDHAGQIGRWRIRNGERPIDPPTVREEATGSGTPPKWDES